MKIEQKGYVLYRPDTNQFYGGVIDSFGGQWWEGDITDDIQLYEDAQTAMLVQKSLKDRNGIEIKLMKYKKTIKVEEQDAKN